MRRKDREVTDDRHIDRIILACHCCRLGFAEEKGCYILPLNFGYQNKNGKRTFYFHGASEGKKIKLIAAQPAVGFELDCGYKLISGEHPCVFSFQYQSVIGKGDIHPVIDKEEKRQALALIMEHYTEKNDWIFSDTEIEKVVVFRLDVSELSCKEH